MFHRILCNIVECSVAYCIFRQMWLVIIYMQKIYNIIHSTYIYKYFSVGRHIVFYSKQYKATIYPILLFQYLFEWQPKMDGHRYINLMYVKKYKKHIKSLHYKVKNRKLNNLIRQPGNNSQVISIVLTCLLYKLLLQYFFILIEKVKMLINEYVFIGLHGPLHKLTGIWSYHCQDSLIS